MLRATMAELFKLSTTRSIIDFAQGKSVGSDADGFASPENGNTDAKRVVIREEFPLGMCRRDRFATLD